MAVISDRFWLRQTRSSSQSWPLLFQQSQDLFRLGLHPIGLWPDHPVKFFQRRGNLLPLAAVPAPNGLGQVFFAVGIAVNPLGEDGSGPLEKESLPWRYLASSWGITPCTRR